MFVRLGWQVLRLLQQDSSETADSRALHRRRKRKPHLPNPAQVKVANLRFDGTAITGKSTPIDVLPRITGDVDGKFLVELRSSTELESELVPLSNQSLLTRQNCVPAINKSIQSKLLLR